MASQKHCNISVGNLWHNVTVPELCDTFKTFGVIISAEIERIGFGYIQFMKPESAHEAVKKLNGVSTAIGKSLAIKIYDKKNKSSSERKQLKPPEEQTLVYVNNFKDLMDEADLEFLFSRFGKIVSSNIEKKNGKSKGYGFIDFEQHESAKRAVASLNGRIFKGRTLNVCMAESREEREARLRLEKIGLEATGENSEVIAKVDLVRTTQYNNLHVANLPTSLADGHLHSLFEPFGNIVSSVVMKNEDNRSKGFGFVCFKTEEQAQSAIMNMDGYKIGTNILKVSFKQDKKCREKFLSTVNLKQKAARAVSQAKPKRMYSSERNVSAN